MFPPSFQDVNKRITEKYLNYDNGFFIEVGGADGITQSNTWHLEMYKNWTGILIEPNKEAATKCFYNRPKSKVYNYALVSDTYSEDEIKMLRRIWYTGDPGLTSSAHDSIINDIEQWRGYNEEFIAPSTTLTCLLDNFDMTGKEIDFFSLDVEGYELEVLKGFNLSKYKPKILLVEWHLDISEIEDYIKNTHKLEERLSNHDYIFTLRD